jgi:Pyridoxal-dependent decarboxylase, pyridoxal binding domain
MCSTDLRAYSLLSAHLQISDADANVYVYMYVYHESQVPDLLKEVKKLGMKVVGVSFHVGSGMYSTNLCYIYLCKWYCSVDTSYTVATRRTTY